jgi:hypothetical protein
MIQNILQQRLNDALYDKDQAPGWAHEISQEIKQKLLGIRYIDNNCCTLHVISLIRLLFDRFRIESI